ncbi:hypothetical protein TNCV_4839421 [Trichonephila clavipes]|nr:hypothetical protein TNCV_4839421 [Trichonephila clavipes]
MASPREQTRGSVLLKQTEWWRALFLCSCRENRFRRAATGQVAATRWPTNYNQYATLPPDMQQQWAAAWASHCP